MELSSSFPLCIILGRPSETPSSCLPELRLWRQYKTLARASLMRQTNWMYRLIGARSTPRRSQPQNERGLDLTIVKNRMSNDADTNHHGCFGIVSSSEVIPSSQACGDIKSVLAFCAGGKKTTSRKTSYLYSEPAGVPKDPQNQRTFLDELVDRQGGDVGVVLDPFYLVTLIEECVCDSR